MYKRQTNENAILSTIFGLSARREFGAAKSAPTAGHECQGAAQELSESVQGGGQGHPGRPRSGPRGAGSGQKLARKRPDRPRAAQEPPRPAQEPDTTASGALKEAAGGLPGLCFGALSGTWLLEEMSGEY